MASKEKASIEKNDKTTLTFELSAEQLAALNTVINDPDIVRDLSSEIKGNKLKVSFIHCNRAFTTVRRKPQ